MKLEALQKFGGFKMAKRFRTLARLVHVILLDQFFDFLNHRRQVGLNETHVGRWNTLMFDVGRNVFMVGKRSSKFGIIRMWLCIIPSQLFMIAPQLVAIIFDDNGAVIKRQTLF